MRLLLGWLGAALLLSGVTLAQSSGPGSGAGSTGAGSSPEHPGSENGVGESSLWTQIGFYDHADSGDGNPFLDEALTVIEPVIIWDSQVTDDWGYAIKLSFDSITSASIDRLSAFPEQSGASGDTYLSLNYSSRHKWNEREDFTWNVGLSKEYDYLSIGAGLGYKTSNPEVGSTDTFTLNSYFDVVDIIRYNGIEQGTDDRVSITGTWTHTRPLTPKWTGTLSTLLSLQSGFLETPYNAVVLEDSVFPANPFLDNNAQGIEITEELPDTRIRASVKATGRRWMSSTTAFEVAGRLYGDDWGIVGVSLEPRWFWMLDESVRMRFRYRYYTQTEADEYVENLLGTSILGAPEFRTQDSDLAAFDSHTFGVRTDWLESGRTKWSLDFNYALREDGLNHLYASIGTRWEL